MVSIERKGIVGYIFKCGGSILDETSVLTAANCVYEYTYIFHFYIFYSINSSYNLFCFTLEFSAFNYPFFSVDATLYRVVVGEHDRSNTNELEQVINVTSFVAHAEFDPTTLHNDIAILKVHIKSHVGYR